MTHDEDGQPLPEREERQAETDFRGRMSDWKNKQTHEQSPGRPIWVTDRELGTALMAGGRVYLGPEREEYSFERLCREAGLNLPALSIERQTVAAARVAKLLHWGRFIRHLLGELPFVEIPGINDEAVVEVILDWGLERERVQLPGPGCFPPLAFVRS
jgi:hypothetical protein